MPIVSLPADVDGGTWANAWQSMKASADYIAYLQKSADWQYPLAPGVAGSDTPQAAWKDSAGNRRYLIDHNGLPMGARMSQLREDWLFSISQAAAGAISPLPNTSGIWATNTTGAGSQVVAVQPQDSTYQAVAININGGTANAGIGNISTTIAQWFPATALVLVIEFEFFMSLVGANLVTYSLGFSDNVDPAANANTMRFDKRSADTNWQCVTGAGAGGALNRVDSGVPPVGSTYQRFRLEYHGTLTALGVAAVEAVGANTAKARYFINGTRVATIGASMPVAQMNLLFGAKTTGAAASSGRVGPVLVSWNRFLSADAL